MFSKHLFGLCVISIVSCSEVSIRPADPLVGRIFSAVSQAELSSNELYDRMDNTEVIYLGETHDNKHHHELQKQIIQQLLQRGRRPAIGFEFFSVEQTPYLMQFVQGGALPKDSSRDKLQETRLRKQLGWTERPDPSWEAYFSLIKIARDNQLPVFGADLPKAIRYRLGRVDVNELTAIERTQLVSTGFEDAAYRQLMFEKFTRAHCGWNDPVILQRLYDTWLLRNDSMAHSIAVMVKSRADEPVVMILGSGHVQHDMGVYERVGYLLPGVVQFNLGFREVELQPVELGKYLKSPEMEGTGFMPDHEYLWFTQRVSYDDPCHRFRHKLKRKGQ